MPASGFLTEHWEKREQRIMSLQIILWLKTAIPPVWLGKCGTCLCYGGGMLQHRQSSLWEWGGNCPREVPGAEGKDEAAPEAEGRWCAKPSAAEREGEMQPFPWRVKILEGESGTLQHSSRMVLMSWQSTSNGSGRILLGQLPSVQCSLTVYTWCVLCS